MAKKIFALFVVCMVLIATIKVEAARDTDSEPLTERYVTCYNVCDEQCKASGRDKSDCEIKCDEECSDKELQAMLNEVKQ